MVVLAFEAPARRLSFVVNVLETGGRFILNPVTAPILENLDNVVASSSVEVRNAGTCGGDCVRILRIGMGG